MLLMRKAIIVYMLFECSLFANSALSEMIIIFSQFLKNPMQVGEVAPISNLAGKELSKFVVHNADKDSVSVLEVGAGCGSVSCIIARQLRPQDHLDLIEINPEMYEILKKRFASYTNIAVHCCSILDWPCDKKYDYIISTLPFNSLGKEFAQNVIALFKQLIVDDGIISYLEYPLVRQVIQHFYGQERKARFQDVQQYLKTVRSEFLFDQATVFLNIPPVNIYHLKFL